MGEGIILSSENCFANNNCKVYLDNECEPNTYCPRLVKLNNLYNSALLSDEQRKSRILKPSKVDVQTFRKLKEAENNIKDIVDNGYNLYIYSQTTGMVKQPGLLSLCKRMQIRFGIIQIHQEECYLLMFLNI